MVWCNDLATQRFLGNATIAIIHRSSFSGCTLYFLDLGSQSEPTVIYLRHYTILLAVCELKCSTAFLFLAQ